MLADPPCPACDQHSWQKVRLRTFKRDPPRTNAYLRLRYRVLFELWAPGEAVFVATFVMCTACGFVAYTPRATEAEIDAKYRMIADEQRKVGTPTPVRTTPTRLDFDRSAELFASLAEFLPASGRILDFGGGNGALMTRFAAANFSCGVVDYTPVTVPGVERLGDTLDDLPADARFEVIFCSHVFEHVAKPVAMAERLAARLAEGGVLFVEVPLEILGGPPRMREPVTHVNFFCEGSLATTLSRAGLEILHARTEACLFASGAYRYGVRMVARQAQDPRPLALPGADEARRLLDSGPLARAAMAVANPRVFLTPVRMLGRLFSS